MAVDLSLRFKNWRVLSPVEMFGVFRPDGETVRALRGAEGSGGINVSRQKVLVVENVKDSSLDLVPPLTKVAGLRASLNQRMAQSAKMV